jgi:S-adenosylhomocysteine hydrolase
MVVDHDVKDINLARSGVLRIEWAEKAFGSQPVCT